MIKIVSDFEYIKLIIGILLTTGPEYQNSQSVHTFAYALLCAGNEVKLFLMDDGIYNIVCGLAYKVAESFEGLQSKGLEIMLCRQSAERRGVLEANCLSETIWCSQIELAKCLAISDRFLSFGR